MVPNKTLIGVSTGEYSRRADFYDYYNLLTKPPECAVLFGHDRSPARNRNILIQAALDNNCTHILLVDDDMAYQADALVKLLDHDHDIISGLYLSRAYPHQPMIFDLADDDGSACPMYLMGNEPRLVPMVAAGFGFLLIKTSIFKKLEKPYIRMGELDPEQWCDDMGFFHRVRKAGITDMWCDLDVMCGHMGTMIIWPNKDKKGQWMTGYDTNGSGAINTPQINPSVAYEFQEKK